MNPFDAPPSTPAVSYEPPQNPKRRRGRTVGAVLLGAALVGVGALGAIALAPAEDVRAESTRTDDVQINQVDQVGATSGDESFELDEDTIREFGACVGLPDGWLEATPPLDELLGGEWDGEMPPLDELFEEWDGEVPPLDELLGEEFDLQALLDQMIGELDAEGEFRLDEFLDGVVDENA